MNEDIIYKTETIEDILNTIEAIAERNQIHKNYKILFNNNRYILTDIINSPFKNSLRLINYHKNKDTYTVLKNINSDDMDTTINEFRRYINILKNKKIIAAEDIRKNIKNKNKRNINNNKQYILNSILGNLDALLVIDNIDTKKERTVSYMYYSTKYDNTYINSLSFYYNTDSLSIEIKSNIPYENINGGTEPNINNINKLIY